MPTDFLRSPSTPGTNTPVYQFAFVKKCHFLIAHGYARLNALSFRNAEETEITGELVREIKNLLESMEAPTWMAHFFVADDPPQSSPGRFGKRRRRVDIEFERSQRGPRPRFHFEAKRLHRTGSVADYLGNDGLCLFVRGEYASKQDAGGMIGYVQADEPPIWIERIREALTSSSVRYAFNSTIGLTRIGVITTPDGTHLSQHNRITLGRPIVIYHTLLRF